MASGRRVGYSFIRTFPTKLQVFVLSNLMKNIGWHSMWTAPNRLTRFNILAMFLAVQTESLVSRLLLLRHRTPIFDNADNFYFFLTVLAIFTILDNFDNDNDNQRDWAVLFCFKCEAGERRKESWNTKPGKLSWWWMNCVIVWFEYVLDGRENNFASWILWKNRDIAWTTSIW